MPSVLQHIGLGIITFPFRREVGFRYTGGEYLQWVSDLLATSESVVGFQYSCADEFHDDEYEVYESDLDERNTSAMSGGFLHWISFDIEIPKDFESSWVSAKLYRDTTITVVIEYGFYSSSSYFIANADCAISPSDLTSISIEYLRGCINSDDSNLGMSLFSPPSLMYDIYLYRDFIDGLDSFCEGVQYKYESKRIYSRLNLYYDSSFYPDEDLAVSKIVEIASDSIQLINYLSRFEQLYLMKWHDIYSHCELISSNKIDLMKSVRAFKDMDRLNHLSSLAIELEIELNTTRSEVYKSIERENKLNRFTFYDSISSLDRDIDRYDINLLKQYISSLKEWRTKRVEWLVNAIVAMLAGSVGALITMAFSGATKVP